MSLLTQEQALRFAQRIWGSRAFAVVDRQTLPADEALAHAQARATGKGVYVVPTGPVTKYRVGYYRTGKRGARLSTWVNGPSFEDCFTQWYARSQKAREVARRYAELVR